MITFYDFYRYYTTRVASSNYSRTTAPSAVAIAESIKDNRTKSWLLFPIKAFKDLLTKNDDDRIKGYYSLERLHNLYPRKSPMTFAKAYIIYIISGFSVAVAEYLPIYIGESYRVTNMIIEKNRQIHVNTTRKTYMDKNARVPEEIVKDFYTSINVIDSVCRNYAWDDRPDAVIENCIANIVVFINQFCAVHKITPEQFNVACQVPIMDDFKNYVLGE